MSTERDRIKCLILPLSGQGVIIPNALAAEIISQQDVTAIDEAPPWLLGSGSWRGVEVPLICLDCLLGLRQEPPPAAGRYLVLHVHRDDLPLTHYAIRVEQLPRTETIARTAMEIRHDARAGLDCVVSQVRLGERECLIPDLDAVLEALTGLSAQ